MLDKASYFAYRGGSAVANALPRGVATRLAQILGRTAAFFVPKKRRIVERNLLRATDNQLRGFALQMAVSNTFASYGRYWIELFRLPRLASADGNRLDEVVDAEGVQHITDALALGNGVVVALPHLGGFDVAAAWLASTGVPSTVVVEEVNPPELFEWFAWTRRAIGMEIVPLGQEAGAAILSALRANGVVGLLSDRDLVGGGVPVMFFGEETTLPAGPAVLALRTGAPLIVAGAYFREHGRHFVRFSAPLNVQREGRLRDDVARVMGDVARNMEDLIRIAPEQWHVMQPNWPSDHDLNAR